MSQIAWSDELSVGQQRLDAQHKRLIRLINAVQAPGQDAAALADVLEKLLAYAAKHFGDEENYIVAHAPQLIERHFPLHSAFIEKVYGFVHSFNEGCTTELQPLVHAFLCDWLAAHIKEEDQLYAEAKRQKAKAQASA